MDWIDFGKQFGFPALVLFVVLVGLYRVAHFYVREALLPESKRRIAYWDSKEKTDTQMIATLAAIARTCDSISERQDQHIEICRNEKTQYIPLKKGTE